MRTGEDYIKYLDNIAASKNCPFFRELQSPSEEISVIDGREVIMLGSNNYLGLTMNPLVIEAATNAIKLYGTGYTGSRVLNGTSSLHTELEFRLSRFFNKESALVFSSGFLTNLAVIGTLGTRNTHLIADRESHASIIDGLHLSYAKVHRFEHNKPDSLREQLERLPPDKNKWVIVEGVYSMLGDISPLRDIIHIAKDFDAGVIVDDAHGIGVMGNNGRGTSNYCGVEDEVDLIIGTFSKSFASYGGFAAGKRTLINMLKYTARPFMFTASLPPANAATVISVLDILENNTEIIEQLWCNTRYLNDKFIQQGVIEEASKTPIIPIHIGDDELTLEIWRALYNKGIYTNAVLPPAVHEGQSMLRISMMASMTTEHLDMAATAIADTYHSEIHGSHQQFDGFGKSYGIRDETSKLD